MLPPRLPSRRVKAVILGVIGASFLGLLLRETFHSETADLPTRGIMLVLVLVASVTVFGDVAEMWRGYR